MVRTTTSIGRQWRFFFPAVQTHLVRNSTVSRTEIEDVRILGDRVGPVEAGQKTVVGRLGGLVNGIGRFSENPVVNVKATAAHDVLVENSGMFFII